MWTNKSVILSHVLAVLTVNFFIAGLAGNSVSDIFQNNHVQPEGCQNDTTITSKGHCALSCRSQANCQAFAFADTNCEICYGNKISNLTFLRGQHHFFKYNDCYNNGSSHNVARVRYGVVIRFALTVLDNSKVMLNLVNVDETQIIFHLELTLNTNQFMMNSANVSGRVVEWDTEDNRLSPVEFSIGNTTQVHILIARAGYLIFFNEIYSGLFPHRELVRNVKRFAWEGLYWPDYLCY